MAMVQLAFYDEQYQQAAQITYSAGFLVQIIGLGIVIPIAEELMFRGILYKRFRERQGFWYSALWSALLFSFIHSNTTQMIYAFLLGVLLSYLYEKFGSFRAPVVLHILLNTGSVVFYGAGCIPLDCRQSCADGGGGHCRSVSLFSNVCGDPENAGEDRNASEYR